MTFSAAATEPIDHFAELMAEVSKLIEANEITHLLAREEHHHLSEPLQAHIDLLDELIQRLKVKVAALSF